MWAGLPWPSLPGCGPDDANIGNGIAEDARLGRCAESLRKSGLVQPGGVCTSMEVSCELLIGRVICMFFFNCFNLEVGVGFVFRFFLTFFLTFCFYVFLHEKWTGIMAYSFILLFKRIFSWKNLSSEPRFYFAQPPHALETSIEIPACLPVWPPRKHQTSSNSEKWTITKWQAAQQHQPRHHHRCTAQQHREQQQASHTNDVQLSSIENRQQQTLQTSTIDDSSTYLSCFEVYRDFQRQLRCVLVLDFSFLFCVFLFY